MGDRLQTGEPYKGLAGAAVSPVLIASWGRDQKTYAICVTRGFMGPLRVLALTRQEACDRLETTVMRPSGTRENKQTNIIPRLYSKVWPMLSIFDSNKQKTAVGN
jgi:hypothetical protein